MESPHNLGGNYWGTLINPDKSPAPLLEQLCLGIAQFMATLKPCCDATDLTPEKLASFYREVGGNYDTLFHRTKGPALSFIYQSLGCFHTLQPTGNPFEPPQVPALLPGGFVRWQTIQLLLSPDEHSQYLQTAVSKWDIPNPKGGTFPKVIPREAFPETPDKDMVQWHDNLSQHLEKEYHGRNTPHEPPGDFIRYYPVRNGGRELPLSAADYFSHEGLSRHHVGSRTRAESHDDARSGRRRRSTEGRGPWQFKSDPACDGSRRSGNSRNTSPPPGQPPLRARSMKVRGRERPTNSVPSSRHHRRFGVSSSSESSYNEEPLRPSRRRGSIDDRQHGRQHLSPARAPLPRRHSHDATSPYRRDRDRAGDLYSSSRRDPDSSRSRRHSSRNKSDEMSSSARHAGAKLQDYYFGDTSHPSRRDHFHPDKGNLPRVQVESGDSSPIEPRRSSYGTNSPGHRSSSGSSGSDRARTSSNAGIGNVWSRWDNLLSGAARKVPVYE